MRNRNSFWAFALLLALISLGSVRLSFAGPQAGGFLYVDREEKEAHFDRDWGSARWYDRDTDWGTFRRYDSDEPLHGDLHVIVPTDRDRDRYKVYEHRRFEERESHEDDD